MNNQYYNYSTLNNNCAGNLSCPQNVLTDAHKFFNLNEPDYKKVYTKTDLSLPLVYESTNNTNSNGSAIASTENFIPQITTRKSCCGSK